MQAQSSCSLLGDLTVAASANIPLPVVAMPRAFAATDKRPHPLQNNGCRPPVRLLLPRSKAAALRPGASRSFARRLCCRSGARISNLTSISEVYHYSSQNRLSDMAV